MNTETLITRLARKTLGRPARRGILDSWAVDAVWQAAEEVGLDYPYSGWNPPAGVSLTELSKSYMAQYRRDFGDIAETSAAMSVGTQ